MQTWDQEVWFLEILRLKDSVLLWSSYLPLITLC